MANPIGPCRLCLQTAELQLSHIYPKFTYRRMREDHPQKRFFKFSTRSEDPEGLTIQDGYKEHLLCSGCEQRLQGWETPFAARINIEKVFDFAPRPDRPVVTVTGFDFTKTKLYLLSLLWRSAITSDPSFRGVQLGTRHVERLRSMLLVGEPGEPHHYGCTITVPFLEPNSGEVLIRIPVTSNPSKIRWEHGLRLVRMMIDGILFQFVVGADDLIARHPTCALFLQRNGSVRVGSKNAMEIAFLRESWGPTIQRAGGLTHEDRRNSLSRKRTEPQSPGRQVI